MQHEHEDKTTAMVRSWVQYNMRVWNGPARLTGGHENSSKIICELRGERPLWDDYDDYDVTVAAASDIGLRSDVAVDLARASGQIYQHLGNFGKICQTLEGSFSAISKPIFVKELYFQRNESGRGIFQ